MRDDCQGCQWAKEHGLSYGARFCVLYGIPIRSNRKRCINYRERVAKWQEEEQARAKEPQAFGASTQLLQGKA